MGGRVTTVEEWLDLSPEEVAVIDMKIRLGEELKARRRKKRSSSKLSAPHSNLIANGSLCSSPIPKPLPLLRNPQARKDLATFDGSA